MPAGVDLCEEVLRCPVSHGPLRPLTPAELEQASRLARQPLSAGLASADGRLAYPSEDGVLTLLAERAIVLADPLRETAQELRREKDSVRAFYDEVGWRRTPEDVFEDTARFVDQRPVVAEYLARTRRRVGRLLEPGGKYLLDVASGPVQFPEYVEYSDGFELRICVDLSAVALAAAREQLGERAAYVLGDITNLPLQDNSVDGIVSLHTIYHVPEAEQAVAFNELYRVLRPGGVAVVAYIWEPTPWRRLSLGARLAVLPGRVLRRLRSRRPAPAEPTDEGEPKLYFHAFDHGWFVEQNWPFDADVLVGQSVTPEFLRRWIRPNLFGRQLLGLIYRLEEAFPRLAGRFGRYPLIVIRRP